MSLQRATTVLRMIHRFGAISALETTATLATAALRRGGRIADVSLPGYRAPVALRVNTSDIKVFDQVFVSQQYSEDCGIKPTFILDCGAHIGLTAVYFAAKYPDATICAVEADAVNYELLRRNTAPYENVRPVHGALWGENELLRVSNADGDTWTPTVGRTTADSRENRVEGYTIERLMAEHGARHIDVLKMDIEGAEFEVFTSPHAADWMRRTSLIMVELHDRITPGASRAFYDLLLPFDWSQTINGDVVVVDKRRAKAS